MNASGTPSGEGAASTSELAAVTTGEWAGWECWQGDAFEALTGPFYSRRDGDGAMVLAIRAEPRHMNGGGSMHGGCLMTAADAALFTIARDEMASAHGVTLHLSGEFLAPVPLGALVEARGEVLRGGGKTVFVRGILTANGVRALAFEGIIRKLGSKS